MSCIKLFVSYGIKLIIVIEHKYMYKKSFSKTVHKSLLNFVFSSRCGRRWPLCLSHIFGGLVCIASPFIPRETGLWLIYVFS